MTHKTLSNRSYRPDNNVRPSPESGKKGSSFIPPDFNLSYDKLKQQVAEASAPVFSLSSFWQEEGPDIGTPLDWLLENLLNPEDWEVFWLLPLGYRTLHALLLATTAVARPKTLQPTRVYTEAENTEWRKNGLLFEKSAFCFQLDELHRVTFMEGM